MKKSDTIKTLNPIDTIRSNPRIYWGVDEPTTIEVNTAILEQYEAEHCKSVVIEETSGWQVISTGTNWVKKLIDNQDSINEIFLDAKHFPGGGGNGLRFEALLYILVSDICLSINGSLTVIKGNIDKKTKQKIERISIKKVTIAYRM